MENSKPDSGSREIKSKLISKLHTLIIFIKVAHLKAKDYTSHVILDKCHNELYDIFDTLVEVIHEEYYDINILPTIADCFNNSKSPDEVISQMKLAIEGIKKEIDNKEFKTCKYLLEEFLGVLSKYLFIYRSTHDSINSSGSKSSDSEYAFI